jgi:hypothetical protein
MRDDKPRMLILLLAVSLLLTIGGGWIFPVPLAFSKDEVKKTESQKDAKPETPAPATGTNSGASNMPYTGLAEKNIFHPERKEFPFFSAPEPAKKPQARPQIVLYGVTLAGDYQSASLVQTGRTVRKGEREMLTLRPGEQIGEYRLTKIMPDRIVLEGEGDSFEVLLNDPSKPKQRTVVKTETKPAAVTSTLTSPPAGPAIEPSRPATTGAPTTPATSTTPRSGTVMTPALAPPTTPPNYVPRRGRLMPTTPGVPAPRIPGQTQGQGGP